MIIKLKIFTMIKSPVFINYKLIFFVKEKNNKIYRKIITLRPGTLISTRKNQNLIIYGLEFSFWFH